MRLVNFALDVFVVALAGSALAKQPLERAESGDDFRLIEAKDSSSVVPNRFIVEFEPVS